MDVISFVLYISSCVNKTVVKKATSRVLPMYFFMKENIRKTELFFFCLSMLSLSRSKMLVRIIKHQKRRNREETSYSHLFCFLHFFLLFICFFTHILRFLSTGFFKNVSETYYLQSLMFFSYRMGGGT
jgi:hypothetical protein